MLYWDPTYIIILPAIIFAMIAQISLNSTFSKYKNVYSQRGLTAAEVARQILDDNGLYNVRIEHIAGNLTDHFDPRSQVVRLSDTVYNSTSVASIGVAAHEVGHAIQHATDYAPIKWRNMILPIANVGSKAAMPLILLGFVFSWQTLVTAGIMLYSAIVLFQAVTLPVEFNASSRALRTLEERYILVGDELKGAGKVLRAAAMTYVAGMLSALLSLLRLIAISRRRSD